MRLVLSKIEILPHFQLVDDDGTIFDTTTARPIVMYPGKFLSFQEFAKRVEEEANRDAAAIEQLANRPLW